MVSNRDIKRGLELKKLKKLFLICDTCGKSFDPKLHSINDRCPCGGNLRYEKKLDETDPKVSKLLEEEEFAKRNKKKGFFRKLRDKAKNLFNVFKDPLEVIENAKKMYDNYELNDDEFEKIKIDSIKRLKTFIIDENFFGELKKSKYLFDRKAISKHEYVKIKNIIIEKFFNDEVLTSQNPLFLIREFYSILQEDLLDYLDYEKVKNKSINNVHSMQFSSSVFCRDLNDLRELENSSSINSEEFLKIKQILINKLLNLSIFNPLNFIEDVKLLLDKNIINEKEYAQIKKISINKIKQSNDLELFEQIKDLKKLRINNALTSNEYKEIKNIFISKFTVNEDPFVLIKKVKNLKDESYLDGDDYGLLKEKILVNEINSKSFVILDAYNVLKKLKKLKEELVITLNDYEKLKSLIITKFNKGEISINQDPLFLIRETNSLCNKEFLDAQDYKEIKKVIINKIESYESSNHLLEIKKSVELIELNAITIEDFEYIKNINLKHLNENLNNYNDYINIIIESKELHDKKNINDKEFTNIKKNCLNKIKSKNYPTLKFSELLIKLKELKDYKFLTLEEFDEIKQHYIQRLQSPKEEIDTIISIFTIIKSLVDKDVLTNEEYDKIKQFYITKLINIKTQSVEEQEKVFKEILDLKNRNIFTYYESEKIRTHLRISFYKPYDFFYEISRLKNLKESNNISDKQFDELKEIFVSNFSVNGDPLILLEKSQSLLDEGILTRDEYLEIKEKIVEVFKSKVSTYDFFKEIKRFSSSEFKDIKEIFLSNFSARGDPLVSFEKSKSLLDDGILTLKDYNKIKNECIAEIKKGKFSPTQSFYVISKLKAMKIAENITSGEYEILKQNIISKLLSRDLKSLNLDDIGEEIKKIRSLQSTDAIREDQYQELIKQYNDELERREEEERRKKEREVERREEEERRKKERDVLIKSYASKYDYEIYKLNPLLYNHPIKSDFNKLKELLKSKGYCITDAHLKSLAEGCAYEHHQETLKQKIFGNSPKSLNEILLNHIELYEDNYNSPNKIKDLNSLLINEGYRYTDFDIINRLQALIEEKGLLPLTLYDIDKMSGSEFETFLKLLFEKMGYEADKTKGSGDQGADLIIKKLGKKTAVQAKRWDGKVGNKAVSEVTGSIKLYNAEQGMVITNSEFTPKAIELAHANNIKLIDREELENLIKNYPVQRFKLRGENEEE